ncbi:signal recognition particle, SRP19 subunit [Basidiobolus meristosporus CBS 931.73]|uniref:Signal recognition particle, SRP19 subunit n=1 Tax=Basidiobolus meristosporus CBS 931.73 TaxID=1314790 RepID=A0A1Y1XL51_9FUNG|nr:signal recognition particle, SRP19 subunit [Basidiobolus meristosporus CBS 931.73]|eukprot:ORX86488.1 signal recognition particle, SRP19 subunit [Basidiobolus meristosporus CBS 931.73]
MSLNELKKLARQKQDNFFLDDEDDIDNMDFPLPDVPSAGPSSDTGIRYIDSDEVFKRWICVYPAYLDSEKTVEEGRRIPKDKACKEPQVRQIAEAAKELGFPVAIEPTKRYPRDGLTFGRIKVMLKNENGFFNRPDIVTRKQLFLKIASVLPAVQARIPAEPKPTLMNTMAVAESSQSTTSAPKKKKKGRK